MRPRILSLCLAGLLCLSPLELLAFHEIQAPETVQAPDTSIEKDFGPDDPYEKDSPEWLVWGMFMQTYDYKPVFGNRESPLYSRTTLGQDVVNVLAANDDNFTLSDQPMAGAVGYGPDGLAFIQAVTSSNFAYWIMTEDGPARREAPLSQSSLWVFATPPKPVTTGKVRIIVSDPGADIARAAGYGDVMSVKYDIYEGSEKIEEASADQILELEKGSYEIRAQKVPDGYSALSAVKLDIQPGTEADIKISWQPDGVHKPALLLTSIDGKSAGWPGASLAGAVYEVGYLSDKDADPVIWWQLHTDDNGTLVYDDAALEKGSHELYKVAGQPMLPMGKLKVRLKSASPGYVPEQTEWDVDITEKGLASINQKMKATVFRAAVERDGLDGDVAVKGQKVMIEQTDGDKKKIELAADDAGNIIARGLPAGNYELKLKGLQAGYQKPETESWKFEMTADGQVKGEDVKNGTLSVRLELKPYSLQLRQGSLSGRTISIYESKDAATPCKTGVMKDGTVTFEDLLPDHQYYVDVDAPWYDLATGRDPFYAKTTADGLVFYADGKKTGRSDGVSITGTVDDASVFAPLDLLHKEDSQMVFIILAAVAILVLVIVIFFVVRNRKKKKDAGDGDAGDAVVLGKDDLDQDIETGVEGIVDEFEKNGSEDDEIDDRSIVSGDRSESVDLQDQDGEGPEDLLE